MRGQAELTTLGTLNTWHHCSHAERGHENLSFQGINHLLFWLNSPFLFIHFKLTLHNKESVAARGDPWACGGRSEGAPQPLHPASSLSLQSLQDAVTAMIKMHSEVAFTLRVVVCCRDAMTGDWSNRGLRHFYDVLWCWIIRSLAAAELLF